LGRANSVKQYRPLAFEVNQQLADLTAIRFT